MALRVAAQRQRSAPIDSVQTHIPCGFARDRRAARRAFASGARQQSAGIYLSRFTQVVGCQQQGFGPSVTRPCNQGGRNGLDAGHRGEQNARERRLRLVRDEEGATRMLKLGQNASANQATFMMAEL